MESDPASMGRKRKHKGKCGSKTKVFKKKRDLPDNTSTSVFEQVMGNHVILTEIFKFVGSSELMNLRCVNTKWNDVIASTLILRKSCMLAFDRRFVKWGKPPTKQIPPSSIPTSSGSSAPKGTKSKPRTAKPAVDQNMAALNQCIANSSKFPCTSIEFGPGNWNLENENFQNFFQLCGSNIKILEINANHPQPMIALQKLFLQQLPNIEHLIIKSISASSAVVDNVNPFRLFPIGEGEGRVFLPSLKTFRFDCSSNRTIFLDLLTAAMNLERVEICSVGLVDVLVKSGRASALKGLSIKPCPRLDVALFDQISFIRLATLCPQLENLTICFHPAVGRPGDIPLAVLAALSSIVGSSSKTLRTLDIRAMSFISQITPFPHLPSLESLYLGDTRKSFTPSFENNQRIFPHGLVMAQTFQNLKMVVLRFPYLNFSVNFPDDRYQQVGVIDPFSTVKTLIVESELGDYELAVLFAKFPNTKQLVFTNFAVKRPLNNSVWKLPPSVESIEFREMRFNASLKNADSFFTGFQEGICENLSRLKRNPKKVDIELLQVMPSILNARNLKNLKMVFNHRQNRRPALKDYFAQKPFISEVAGLYAFSRMPQLNVIFAYNFNGPDAKDIARIFEPLRTYVRIEHEEFHVRNAS